MRLIVQPKSGALNVDFYEVNGRRLNYKIRNDCLKHRMSYTQKGHLEQWETMCQLKSAM